MATRAAIMQALFDKLKTAYVFKSSGRRLVDPDNVAGDKRPALYVVKHDEDFVRPAHNLPPILELYAWAIVFTQIPDDALGMPDSNAIPEDQENDILDAIESALAPSPSDDGRQTLGGLVRACIIQSRAERGPSDVSGKGIVAIPIKIIRP